MLFIRILAEKLKCAARERCALQWCRPTARTAARAFVYGVHVDACTSYPIPSYTVVTYPAFIHFSFGNVLPETVLPWGFNGFAPETGGVQGSSADNDEFTVVNENGGESRCLCLCHSVSTMSLCVTLCLRLFLNQCSVLQPRHMSLTTTTRYVHTPTPPFQASGSTTKVLDSLASASRISPVRGRETTARCASWRR